MSKVSWSDKLIFSLVYFVQGALGLSGLALPFFLRESLQLSIPQMSFLFGIVALPWVFKPIYGLISDFHPLFGFHRKSYLALASLLAVLGWTATALTNNYWIVLISQLLAALGIAASDVVADGLAVQKSTNKTRGLIQSICWGSRSVGAILTAFLGGYLLTILSFQTIFLITASLPLLTFIVSFIIKEKKQVQKKKLSNFLHHLIKVYKNTPTIWWISLFLFIWFMGPSFSLPLLFHLKEELFLSETIIGGFRSIFYVGGVLGALFFAKKLDFLPHRKSLRFLIWANIVGILAFLIIKNPATGFTVYFFNGIISIATMVAAMKLIAEVCPKRVEATTFALVTGIANLASGTISQWFGAYVYSLVGYLPLVLISAAFGILPLFFLKKIPNTHKS